MTTQVVEQSGAKTQQPKPEAGPEAAPAPKPAEEPSASNDLQKFWERAAMDLSRFRRG